MKFTVAYDVFTDAVTWVARTIPSRPAIPILAGLKISANEDGQVSLSSRDSDITSHINIFGDIKETGEILVNGKLLSEICRSLPKKEISFIVENKNLKISCGSAKFSIKSMEMADYLEFPVLSKKIGSVDGTLWQEAVSQVSVAASNDDTLPLLTAICMEIEENKISLLATDKYRLCLRELLWDATDKYTNKILVKASRVLDIAKSSGAAKVELFVDDLEKPALIGFSAGGKESVLQIIDGEYPEVKRLFPETSTGNILLNRSLFVDALRRSRLVAEKNPAVNLGFNEEEIVIEAGQGETAQASEVVEAQLTGDEISFRFNPIILQSTIESIREEKIRILYTQENKAVLIKAENEKGESNEDLRILVMPTRKF